MKKILILCLSVFMIGTTAEAQFLKKLKDKVQEKVENAAIDNVSDKAANETNKGLNSMWEKKLSEGNIAMGMERVNPEEIPASYDFDWVYNMHITHKNGEMDMLYHLKKDAPYFGMEMQQQGEMFIVFDDRNDLSVMFMNSGENKYLMATKLNIEDTSEESEDYYDDMELKEIGSKTILGFECQGYQGENEDYIFNFYVTKEAGIGFTGMFQDKQNNMPEEFNPEWLQDGDALLMEMQMEDKKRTNNSMSMTCTRIEKESVTIRKSDFNSMGGQ
ncbi:DUF4412 domain-containing protein [Salegentibacter sp. F188]|uniref:DUF4412 domain-containing protein n=1 Tax=Autumnicola patrickiae TaxID=3075591 RepID=A0ABU3E4C0_9FLAO|nr:DUF4412 domain-containing protein [Salegentibacter sp. F188]MDT0690847.1 DUF4412 domain-containing protein [Salegentibacter sp. F188]